MAISIWLNAGNVTIRNCTINRPIQVSGVSNVLIEGNTFQSNSFDICAITLSGALENITIKNNSYSTSLSSALVRVYDGTFNNVAFTGNTTTGTGTMIKFASGQAAFDQAIMDGKVTGVVKESDSKYTQV